MPYLILYALLVAEQRKLATAFSIRNIRVEWTDVGCSRTPEYDEYSSLWALTHTYAL